MAIPIPVTQTKIATVPWGIPITNEVNRLTTVTTPSVWVTPTLQNGWTIFGAVQYRKLGDMVQARGRANGTVSFVTMFNLPAGFRPTVDTVFPTTCVAGGAWTPCAIYVTGAGDVQAIGPGTMTSISIVFAFSVTP